MKYLRIVALAAAAVLSLMAIAAGTAQATTLFTNSAHTTDYSAGTVLHLTLVSGTSFRQTPGTCTQSTIGATTTNTTGTAIVATVNVFDHGVCGETTDTVANGSLEINFTSGSNGEVIGKGNSLTSTMFGVSCTYGTGEGTKLGTVTGGTEPLLTINATVAKVAGGFLCPSTTGWHGEFVFTSPHAVYIGN
jgi:hypothetical protein